MFEESGAHATLRVTSENWLGHRAGDEIQISSPSWREQERFEGTKGIGYLQAHIDSNTRKLSVRAGNRGMRSHGDDLAFRLCLSVRAIAICMGQ